MSSGRRRDRRVQKTRDLLHGALASVIHEKSYDAIGVKEILARANVGRSTFYTHFRNKDELLDSGIRDVLRTSETTPPVRSTGSADRILRFSLPLLEHIERHRLAADSEVDAQGQTVVHERLEGVLTELIAGDLGRIGYRPGARRPDVPSGLLAQYVTSTFVVVLNWWVRSGRRLPAREVNELFRALVLPALTGMRG